MKTEDERNPWELRKIVPWRVGTENFNLLRTDLSTMAKDRYRVVKQLSSKHHRFGRDPRRMLPFFIETAVSAAAITMNTAGLPVRTAKKAAMMAFPSR